MECARGARIRAPRHLEFPVSLVSRRAGVNDQLVVSVDGTTTTSCNEFKKNPGVGGSANRNITLSTGVIQLPVANAAAKLTTDAKGTVVIATGATDDDGWYMLPYKWTGKSATVYVTLTPPGYKAQTKQITIKANGFVQVDFTVP